MMQAEAIKVAKLCMPNSGQELNQLKIEEVSIPMM